MSEFDSPWKEALEVFFERMMAFFFPDIHAAIDWNRGYEFLDKELQKITPKAAVGRRNVDKLVKVWQINGAEEWVLIHIEVQSQAESDFAQRMFQYYYRILDRYNQKVASLAVLSDDRAEWRPSTYADELWGCSVQFRFPIVKLLDLAGNWQALEAHDNVFAIVVMAHLKSLETRRDISQRQVWKIRIARTLFERGLGADEIRQLFKFIDWVMSLPDKQDRLFWQEIHEIQESKHMPFITAPERFGRIEGLLEGIELGLDLKFGEEGLKLMPEIREIYNHEKLSVILKAIKTTDSPEALREFLQEVNGDTTDSGDS